MKQIVIRALVGLGLGQGFAILQFIVFWAVDRVFNTAQPMRSIELAYQILDAPAVWLSHVWTYVLHLPPRGEIAWVLVPVVMVSIQWSLIGFFAGLWWGFKSTSSASAGGNRIWPVVLIGGGALVACGLLVLIFGIVFSRQVDPDDFKVSPKPNVAAHEQENIEAAHMQEENEVYLALEANPNDAEARYRLGVMMASSNQVGLAMMQFRKALEIKPNYAEADYQMGLALVKEGKLADAIKYYRKALAIKPDFAAARQHLEEAIKMNEEKEASVGQGSP